VDAGRRAPWNQPRLRWRLDADRASARRPWTDQNFHRYALSRLHEALNDQRQRERLRNEIVRGPLARFVEGMEDPIPAHPSSSSMRPLVENGHPGQQNGWPPRGRAAPREIQRIPRLRMPLGEIDPEDIRGERLPRQAPPARILNYGLDGAHHRRHPNEQMLAARDYSGLPRGGEFISVSRGFSFLLSCIHDYHRTGTGPRILG
jgi:hypothetical protein